MSDKCRISRADKKEREHFIRLFELHINCTMRKTANAFDSTQSPQKHKKNCRVGKGSFTLPLSQNRT